MKILIVDDEYTKVQNISEMLHSMDIENLYFKHESTASAARLALRAEKYDLLIIDLYLPEVMGEAPNQKGGLSLFDLICIDTLVQLPSEIIFITSKEESDSITEMVAQKGAMLFKYRNDCEGWKKSLQGKVRYIANRNIRNFRDQDRVDVAIVTALRTPELEAVLKLPYDWKVRKLPNDATTYHFGKKNVGDDKVINIVAASAMRKGMPSSASLASKMTFAFQPKYLLMLGICAGVPDKVNFGDIIIANPTWDWGSGKNSQATTGEPLFQSAPHQVALDSRLSQLVSEVITNTHAIANIQSSWQGAVPQTILKAHIGPMASGASVIADDHSLKSISDQHREIIAVEMEAYAVMSAVEYAPDPKPIALVVKSVCDHANPVKDDAWQKYASYTSAKFADLMFDNLNYHL